MSFQCEHCKALTIRIQRLDGFVYILSNESMPGLVKIGFTERTVEERVEELSSHTGVASPYKAEASFPVTGMDVERRIHAELKNFRNSYNREFFRLTPKEAIAAVSKILNIALPAEDTQPPQPGESAPPKSVKSLADELKANNINLGGFGSARYRS